MLFPARSSTEHAGSGRACSDNDKEEMPYLQRTPSRRSDNSPTSISPLLCVAAALFISGVFTHGTVASYLFFSGAIVFILDTALGYPKIVFRGKSVAQKRSHP